MRYEFQAHCLDVQRRELLRGGERVPIARKPFAVLQHLLENRGRLVSKAELLETFWPKMVSENVLQSTIRQIRMAVGDDGRSQGVIRTHHGEGFRFVAVVSVAAPPLAGPVNGLPHRSRSFDPGPAPPGFSDVSLPPPRPALHTTTLDEHRLSAVLACRLSCDGSAACGAGDAAVSDLLGHAERLAARRPNRARITRNVRWRRVCGLNAASAAASTPPPIRSCQRACSTGSSVSSAVSVAPNLASILRARDAIIARGVLRSLGSESSFRKKQRRPTARALNSAMSRDLPMPASPQRTTIWPRPPNARSSVSARKAISASRPTKRSNPRSADGSEVPDAGGKCSSGSAPAAVCRLRTSDGK